MKGRSHNLSGQRGITVVEMLIVVAIIAVVAALAMMRMDGANPKFKRQNVSRELKVALERARFDSVKRHGDGPNAAGTPMPATVIVDTSSFTLKTDSNRDGIYEEHVTDFAAQNITIAPYGIPGSILPPITITFDKRGEADAVDSEPLPVDPQFYVCNVSCSSPTTANADLILVTPTGTVTLLGGDGAPPTFANANVTNPTAYISNVVRLP